MAGGVIRWVLSEIQSLVLCNAPITPLMEPTSNKLEMSTFWFRIKPKSLVTSYYGRRCHSVSFEGNPISRTMHSTNHSIYGTNFVRTWSFQFVWPLISDRVQNLGNIIIWWEESFGDFEGNSITRTMQGTNSIYETNFVRIWSVQFLLPIDFRPIPKHGQHHNIVGGVIRCVLV